MDYQKFESAAIAAMFASEGFRLAFVRSRRANDTDVYIQRANLRQSIRSELKSKGYSDSDATRIISEIEEKARKTF